MFFCFLLVYFFNGISESPSSICLEAKEPKVQDCETKAKNKIEFFIKFPKLAALKQWEFSQFEIPVVKGIFEILCLCGN